MKSQWMVTQVLTLALVAFAVHGLAPGFVTNAEAAIKKGFSKKDYQIGDEWGKKPVTDEQMQSETLAFRRMAMATASYSGGTTFYLGKFNGHHVMATNYHVMEAIGCDGRSATFPFLKMKLRCKQVFGLWTDIDLSLFEVEATPEQATALKSVAQNFAFNASIYPGQEILTMGFGVESNIGGKMMANQDSDCKVFSAKDDFHFMPDPDDFNPGPYKAWSFSSGCDVSHGDSGSAFVDRKSGEIVGIIWTGRIPKPASVSSSKFLDELLRSQGPEIWTALSYSVPASKMQEFLSDLVAHGTLGDDARATIRAVVTSQPD